MVMFMKKIIQQYRKISDQSYTTLAGSISFFFIINGGSVLYLILLIGQAFDFNVFRLFQIEHLPQAVQTVLVTLFQSSSGINPNYSIFFIISSIVSSSSLFFHMIRTGELIYHEEREKFSFIRRFLAIILVLIFLVLVVVSLSLLLLGDMFLRHLQHIILINLFRYLMLFLIPFWIILLINLFVTPNKVKIVQVMPGSIFTTLFWFVATYLFSIYLQIFANFKIIYGALTFLIIFMIWVYLMCQGLVIGFIINYEKKRKNLELYNQTKMAN